MGHVFSNRRLSVFPADNFHFKWFWLNNQFVVRHQIKTGPLRFDVELMHNVSKKQEHLHIDQAFSRTSPVPQSKWNEILGNTKLAIGIQKPVKIPQHVSPI